MNKDIERILFTKEELAERVKEIGAQINNEYAGKRPLVVGILKGSFVFLADLVREIECDIQIDFIGVSSYGSSTETSGNIKIYKDLSADISGRHLILVEDIVDSGLTLKRLSHVLNDRGAASIKICTLLSKPSRRKTQIDIDYCGFTIPDEFIVGYGLDYAEKYRNLPFIGILKREIYS